ncbi:hypothetical protein Mapa_014245 [Marchantia paleacea]|nr:hypothetical protein Mapa_014245 [Marchantia paleacea]
MQSDGLQLGIESRWQRTNLIRRSSPRHSRPDLPCRAGAIQSHWVLHSREIEPRILSPQLVSRLIVCEGGLLCGVEGSEPQTSAVAGQSNLRDPLTPVSLPDTSVQLCLSRASSSPDPLIMLLEFHTLAPRAQIRSVAPRIVLRLPYLRLLLLLLNHAAAAAVVAVERLLKLKKLL